MIAPYLQGVATGHSSPAFPGGAQRHSIQYDLGCLMNAAQVQRPLDVWLDRRHFKIRLIYSAATVRLAARQIRPRQKARERHARSGPQSQLPRPVDGNRRWHVVNGETVSLATIGGEEISAILRQEPADLNSTFSPCDRKRSRPVSACDHWTFLGVVEHHEARFKRLE